MSEITNKTNIRLDVATLIGLIFSIITAIYIFTQWKTLQEAKDIEQDKRISVMEEKAEKFDEMEKSLVEIKTDLKWIRQALETK